MLSNYDMARIIEAEAGVLDFNGKLGVAQCIVDNDYNELAFTDPVDIPSSESIRAAELTKSGVRRFKGWKVLQLRSFTKYADRDGSFDWTKEMWATTLDLIPATDSKGKWGHFYLGRCVDETLRYCGCGIFTAKALEDMNVRDCGNITGNVIGIIPKNSLVEVLSITDLGWFKIVYPGSPNGFAYVSNVKNHYFEILKSEKDTDKIREMITN